MKRILVVFIGLMLFAIHANSSGISYIQKINDINNSSYTSNKVATKFQTIFEVLYTAKKLNFPLDLNFTNNALEYLQSFDYNNTLTITNKFLANSLYDKPTTNLTTTLMKSFNTNGSFGDFNEYDGSIEDTALALKVLFLAKEEEVAKKAISFLLSKQRLNGSWAQRDNEDSIYLTSLATKALWLYRNKYNLQKPIYNAQEYLKKEMSSYLWGDLHQSARVLLALLPLEKDITFFQNSIDNIKALQLLDGSWDNNPYTTSLILQVLALAKNPTPNPDLGSISGRVMDAQTLQPLKQVQINLASSDKNITIFSKADGTFNIDKLEQNHYKMDFSFKGFQKVQGTFSLARGKSLNIGDIYLSKNEANVATGILKGILLDASNLQPIPLANISIDGQKVQSLQDGSYQINNIKNGNYQVKITHPNYNQISTAVQIVANGIIIFSPKMYAKTIISPQERVATIFGNIKDNKTNLALKDVNIALDGNETVFSDANGSYKIVTKKYGKRIIAFEKNGYENLIFEIYLQENATYELSPKMYLKNTPTSPTLNSASLSGKTIDSRTNKPIAQASIQIKYGNKTVSLKSDSNGSFELKGIKKSDVNITTSKEGYNTSTIFAVLEPLKNLDLGQIRLRPQKVVKMLSELSIVKIDTNETETNPHTLEVNGTLHVSFKNSGNAKTTTPIEFTAFYDIDNDGKLTSKDTIIGKQVYSKNMLVDTNDTISLHVKGKSSFLDMPIFVMIDSALHINELDETNNILSSSINSKIQLGEIGKLDPVVKWHWSGSSNYSSHVQVMSTPIVGQTNDDNGDGKIDENDIPDIIFVSFSNGNYYANGVLRVISGKDGKELWSYNHGHPYHGAAIGDIDGDGKIEMAVGNRNANGLVVFENDGKIKWEARTRGHSEPVIADLNADGKPEIIFGSGVFDANGSLLFNISEERLPVVADLDMDGKLEIISNGYAYRHDGSPYWQGRKDGFYPAIGNFDDDKYPEIIMRSQNGISMYDHTGKKIWGPIYIPGGGGGGITIADVDADGKPEIGIAGAHYYVVFETDGSIKWKSRTQDYSSAITGSTVFDFEGDGKAEILYNDEMYFRIYDGESGKVLFQMSNTSGTLWEQPIVADIDNDGHAEIVLASNNYYFRGRAGIIALKSASNSWMPTRSIWNQHSYHITNVNDDGTIPQYEKPSWLTHNTYRLNTFIGRDPRSISDLSVSLLEIYDENQTHTFSVRVGNGGDLISPKSDVAFFKNDPNSGGKLLGSVKIGEISTNQHIDVALKNIKEPFSSKDTIYAIVDFDNKIKEYKKDNNIIFIPFVPKNTQATIKASADKTSYDTNESMKLGASIKNSGLNPYKLYAKLFIEDKNGSLVKTYPFVDVGVLEKNTSKNITQAQNASEFLANTYTLKANLYDKDKKLIQTHKTPFNINVNTGINNLIASLNTISNKPIYSPTDTVQLKNIISNLATNNILKNATLSLHVKELKTNKTIYTTSLHVKELTPKGIQTLIHPFNLVNANLGMYEFKGVLQRDGKVLTTSQGEFQVGFSITQTLIGSVEAKKPILKKDELQTCKDTLKNISTSPLSSIPLKQSLIFLDTNTTVLQESKTLHLDNNSSISLLRDINTSTLEVGNYACLLQAKLNNSWHNLGYAPFMLKQKPIRFDYNISLSNKPRLLILMDGKNLFCFTNCYESEEMTKYLHNLLSKHGYSFDIETNVHSFVKSFRSGKYSAYLLFSKTSKLSIRVQRELQEALHRGEGILIASKHNLTNSPLESAIGVNYFGKHRYTDTLTYNNQYYPLYLGDKKVFPTLINATSLSNFTNNHSAIAYKEYYKGKAIFTSFNLLKYAQRLKNEHEALFLHLIEKLKPNTTPLHVNTIKAYNLSLKNLGLPIQGEVSISYNKNLANFITSTSHNLTHSSNQLSWKYDLRDKNSTNITIYLDILKSGDLNITSKVYADKTLHKTITQTFTINNLPNLDELIALIDKEPSNDYKWVSHLLNKVRFYKNINNHYFAIYYAIEAINILDFIKTNEAKVFHYQVDFIIKDLSKKLI